MSGFRHLWLAGVAAALCVILWRVRLLVGYFGWPLGSEGAHSGLRLPAGVLLVPAVAATLCLISARVLLSTGSRVRTATFSAFGTALVCLVYFAGVDLALVHGLLRGWGFPDIVSWYATRFSFWQAMLVTFLQMWAALEFALWLTTPPPRRQDLMNRHSDRSSIAP